MRKKLINSDLFSDSLIGNNVIYTTASWETGTGGFSWTCPETGWYYLKALFSGKSGTMGYYQLQLRTTGANNLLAYGSGNAWTGTMPVQEISTIAQISKGETITPLVFNGTSGIVITTRLYYVRLK